VDAVVEQGFARRSHRIELLELPVPGGHAGGKNDETWRHEMGVKSEEWGVGSERRMTGFVEWERR
jgi:hypothetical protein